jgi:hypothetical protein
MLRRLPDGSLLDTDTGTTSFANPSRESMGRSMAIQQGKYQPAVPSKGQQIAKVVEVQQPGQMPKYIQQPVAAPLAMNPYELGLGAMSDGTKRMMLTGLIVAAAFGAVWLNKKLGSKPA